MAIYYLLIALLALASLRFRRGDDAYACLEPEQTVCINGIFILVVFVSHLGHLLLQPIGYEMTHFGDRMYRAIQSMHGQLIVVPFFFYSGYGIATQMIAKPNYLGSFFRNRVVPLYLNFLIAFSCYLAVSVVFMDGVRIVDVLKGMFFLHAFGNPTWFLFCTIIAYIVVWTAFKFLHNKIPIIITCFAGMSMYVLIVARFKPTWWYDTALVFPLGVGMALYKDKIIRLLRSNYIVSFSVAAILFLAIFRTSLPCASRLTPTVQGALLMIIILLFTMKIKVSSRPLEWLGKHVFPIYMYHMLFFLFSKIFVSAPLGKASAHLLVVTTFGLTIVTATVYRFWRIDAHKVARTL